MTTNAVFYTLGGFRIPAPPPPTPHPQTCRSWWVLIGSSCVGFSTSHTHRVTVMLFLEK